MKAEQTADGAPAELPVLPLMFTHIDGYTTFRAEFAIVDGDIVYHFYVTEEVQKLRDAHKYWDAVFPATLQTVAREYFNADYPRLQAQYVPEMASWWFRAKGFGQKLDPQRFSYRFFDTFDAALDKEMLKAR
jgi:hypothetical protein